MERIERKEGAYLSPSFSSLPLSFSILLLTSSLPLPLTPPHYFSPCFLSILLTTSPSFLSVILLITSLPPSSQSSSPPLHPSFLSIRHLITSFLFPVHGVRTDKEVGGKDGKNT
jgi:hypothetical protein